MAHASTGQQSRNDGRRTVSLKWRTRRGLQQKPTHLVLVNAGVYLIERNAAQHVPAGCSFDMPQLIEILLSLGIIGFPISEYWLHIGCMSDYEKGLSAGT